MSENESAPKGSSGKRTLGLGLLLLACVLLGGGLVAGSMVDVATCPECKGHEILFTIAKGEQCPTCTGKGKVTCWELVKYKFRSP